MSKDMLGSVVRAAVGVPQDRLDALAKIASRMAESHPMGEVWHENLKKLLLEGLPPTVAIEDFKLFDYLLVPFIIKFVAEKKFRAGMTTDGVKIHSLSEDFKRRFLGVTEENVLHARLRIDEVQKCLSSEAVDAGLRGQEIALAHFWELLKKRTTFTIVRCHGRFVCAYWRPDRRGWFLDSSPSLNRRLTLQGGDHMITYG